MTQSKEFKDKLAEFLSLWCVVENNRKLYGFTMPQAQKARQELARALIAILNKTRELSIIKKEKDIELIGQGWSLTGSELQAKGVVEVIQKSFNALKVDSISFKKDMDSGEFDELLKGLSLTLDELQKQNGLQEYLRKRQVSHIVVDQMRFELLKEGEHIGEGEVEKKEEWELDDEEKNNIAIKGSTSEPWALDEGNVAKAAKGFEVFKPSPEEVAAFWKEYIGNKLSKEEFLHRCQDLLETAKQSPDELIDTFKRIAQKQKDLEAFLADLEQKLQALGFVPSEIHQIKEKLRKDKKVAISQEELLRLRKLEKDFETTLEERVENALKEIKKLNNKLSQETQRMNVLLRQSSQGVIVINKEGAVLSLNSLAEKALGVSLKESQRKQLKDIVKTDQTLSLTSQWQKETDDFTPGEVEVIAHDEKARDVISESSAIIENEDGKPIGTLSSLQKNVIFKELEKRKSEMLDVLGHDLRAPILAAKQNLSVLMEATDFFKNLNSEQKQMAQRCQKNIERMESLVTTIMDIRQLETGKIVLRKEEFDLVKLINDSVELLTSWAADKKITLSAECKNVPLISGDSERIYQVITNLISNALKFTPEGGTVTVKAQVTKKPEACVSISVIDSGIGIKAADLKRVFKKYEQVQLQTPQGASGLGLGLAICKSIVELHGGTIWVESQEGKGSTFIFTLPFST